MTTETATRTLKLLLVDDEPDVRKLCRDLFEQEGYAVTTAATAREAAEKAKQGVYDVAVVDFRLPDARGTSLVRWLRRRFPGLPVVVFSAYADWDLFFRASGCGAKDVVAKTASPAELVRVVRRCAGE
jgi:DNA-binding NtrC family response regulator